MAARTVANDAQSNAGLEANPIEEIVSIRVDQIDEGERLRPIDDIWARALGAIMAREGQRTPIEVCRLPGRSHWTLVTGGHRLAGARAAGIEYLKAIIVGADRAERRMREVSENLHRRELGPLDRASFIAEHVTLLKLRAGIDPHKDGRAASAQARWQKELKDEADDAKLTISFAYGWNDEVAEELGLSLATVKNDLLLHRRLAPSLIERLRAARHPILKNAAQLRALAKLDEAKQRLAVDQLVWEGQTIGNAPAKSISEAISRVEGRRKPLAEDKRLSAFIGAFSRMGVAEKKGALAELQHLLPAGFTIVEGKPAPSRHEHERETLIAAIDETREVIDGILEDELIADFERADALHQAGGKLQLSRMALAADVVPLAGDAA